MGWQSSSTTKEVYSGEYNWSGEGNPWCLDRVDTASRWGKRLLRSFGNEGGGHDQEKGVRRKEKVFFTIDYTFLYSYSLLLSSFSHNYYRLVANVNGVCGCFLPILTPSVS
jgi:hypothetical protein